MSYIRHDMSVKANYPTPNERRYWLLMRRKQIVTIDRTIEN